MNFSPADALEIYNMLGKYGNLIDFEEWHRIPVVFAPDAIFDVTATGYPVMIGLAEIMEKMPRFAGEARYFHLHMTTSPVIESMSTDAAHVRSRVLAIHLDRCVDSGVYDDHFVRIPAGWRIERRTTIPMKVPVLAPVT